MNIWQCPGPARLLAGLVDTLVDGRLAILRTPFLAPKGLEQELATMMGADGWGIVRIEDVGSNPARQVLEAAWVEDALTSEATAATLTERTELAGRVFWCVPQDAAGVERWMAFLDAYAVACRARPDADGPRFVLSLPGDLACPAPSKKIGFEVIDVGDAVNQTDLLLLAYHQTGTTLGTSLKAQVIAQTAASIALWDMALLNRLLDESPEHLFAPASVLQHYAAEQGWEKTTSPSWQGGTLRNLGAKLEVHSALIALDDSKSVISSRVWAGQAAVLLPAIERQRLELIEQNKALLASHLPFKTDYETISDVYDLAIGPVWYLLKNGAPSNTQIRSLRLKKARDSLAHMKPLTPNEAFASAVTGE
jgi:hypothetical protein